MSDRYEHIVTDLSCVRENAGEALKIALTKLNGIVTASYRLKILNDVVAKICGKNEGIRVSVAYEQVVVRRAGERITVVGA